MERKLKNPDINPQVIALKGTSADAKTSFYFEDACSLASDFSLIDTTNGVAMSPQNNLTAAALKAFLQSYALIIKEYRFLAQDDADLSFNLTALHIGIDGRYESEVLFSADSVTPFANNANLLIIKKPFVWTASTAIKITTTAGTGHDMTFTFSIATMVPYGQLDAFLAQNPIAQG